MKETDIKALSLNPFTKIGQGWMLITAGDETKHNTMTASWGGVGVLWGRNVATVYIRPQRYTYGFVDANDYFSCCFFDEKYRNTLNFCGTESGRDYDKPKETGLTPVFDYPAPYYSQASLAFICKKLYKQVFNEELFTDAAIVDAIYPKRDLHYIFIGEIVAVLV
jgi:flavin reductase (DIM6/NTAB) family NADH-FMN oxidoreductase RutF